MVRKEVDMLVLTRKVGERIKIGDNVEVIILGVDGGQVKAGIHAPKEIKIMRSELVKTPKNFG